MKIEAKSAREYIDNAGERGEVIAKLDKFIRENAPDAKPVGDTGIYASMLAYGIMPYNSKSYKEWPLIMIGIQKNHIGLYICAVDNEGKYIAEENESRLGKVSCGKSCIRFKKYEDLNLETLKTILTELNLKYKQGEKLFGK